MGFTVVLGHHNKSLSPEILCNTYFDYWYF